MHRLVVALSRSRPHARRALALVLVLAAPVTAQDPSPEEPPRLEPVVVTPSRLEQRAGEAPASVTVIGREAVRESASQTVDDLLRQVPGFSLFRRSSSIVAQPTTQGVSLRGIGPSGTSRALVLLDEVPINDAFGGWVYWSRIPLLGIEQIEVVRGGGSSVWGNYAVGGVVHALTHRPEQRAALVEASYGSHDTKHVDVWLSEVHGPLRISLEGAHFDTDGYHIVPSGQRGAIDEPADSRHWVFNGRAEADLSRDLTLFVSGNYLDEARGNGTPLQFNETNSGQIAAGGRLRTPAGDWRLTAYGQFQEFRSTFSAQALDRNSETLALDQTVPTASYGGWLGWSRTFGTHLLSAGLDTRWVDGETDEDVFAAGAFLRTRVTGGRQLITGLYVQDVWRPHPAWELVGGVRADWWRSDDGFRRDTPPPAGVPPRQTFDDIDRLLVSPRVAALVHVTPTTDVRASVYRGFRVPTLNEQYRLFRVRNDVTTANPGLEPEILTGGELGAQQRWGPLEARVTGFWNEVQDLVANVTLTTPVADCPAGTTCRQRQNLELARIRGVEAELELRLARRWRLLGSYLFTDARVVDAPQQPGLEGNRLAQVPRHAGTVGVRFTHAALFTAVVQTRIVGDQFEDDLNTLTLGSYVVFDVFLSRALTRWSELFVSVENLLDKEYAVGRTTEGVTTIGAPRLVRGGVRLSF